MNNEKKKTVELWLDDDRYDLFSKGIYYDETGKPHKLECQVHTGMVTDTAIIHYDGRRSVCKYYLDRSDEISIYRLVYDENKVFSPLLVHNDSERPLTVRFDWRKEKWTIPPGGCEELHLHTERGEKKDR